MKKAAKKPTKKSAKKPRKKRSVDNEKPVKPRSRFFYRTCECGALNDVRFKFCHLCNKPTYKERQVKIPRNFQIVDWKDLEKGNEVFVTTNDVWISPVGDAIQMGESGHFKIMRTCQSGLVCYNNVVGFCFFDTVTRGKSKETGIVRGSTKFYVRKWGKIEVSQPPFGNR